MRLKDILSLLERDAALLHERLFQDFLVSGETELSSRGLDLVSFLQLIGRYLVLSSPEEQVVSRDRSYAEWVLYLEEGRLDEYRDREVVHPALVSLSPSDKPPIEGEETNHLLPPAWMSAEEGSLYREGTKRLSFYVSDLSARFSSSLEERYKDEDLEQKVSVDVMEELSRFIDDQAIKQRFDFSRILLTEMQAVINEQILLSGQHFLGGDIRFARITQTTACGVCLKLFRKNASPYDEPIIYYLEDLSLLTPPSGGPSILWPIHPNCQCTTMIVPVGQKLNVTGNLVRGDE